MKCIPDIMAPWVFLDPYPEDSIQSRPDHDFHWHRYTPGHEDWLSLWVDHKEWNHTDEDEWWVEVYPSPEYEDNRENRRVFNDREEAAQFVADFMEKHD